MLRSRLLLRVDEGRFDAIDAADIYFVEAVGGDSVVRTKKEAPVPVNRDACAWSCCGPKTQSNSPFAKHYARYRSPTRD